MERVFRFTRLRPFCLTFSLSILLLPNDKPQGFGLLIKLTPCHQAKLLQTYDSLLFKDPSYRAFIHLDLLGRLFVLSCSFQ